MGWAWWWWWWSGVNVTPLLPFLLYDEVMYIYPVKLYGLCCAITLNPTLTLDTRNVNG